MLYANLAGYLIVAGGGLVLGTLFGNKVTAAIMTMVHGLESRVSTIEGAVGSGRIGSASSGSAQHAAAITAHAAAVTRLADAIGKHAQAVDEHGAATVAAAVEAHAAPMAAAGK